ncbi:MAG: hypothetical protein E7052_05815 [Lentisphaerae bacterium]|nr:hypothetical protein [Lentisphaerota bacterium]
MQKRAVIYARQSSGADDYSESVEVQIANCRKLAAQQHISVVEVFSDLNISGKTYPAGWENLAAADYAFQKWLRQTAAHRQVREGLGQVMRHLSGIDYIIVDDITRLYRPLSRSYLESAVNERLIEYNVKILQVKGGTLDLAQFDQQLITMLKNQINDEQIAKQHLRSIEVLNKLRDSGVMPTGITAYGLIYDRSSKLFSIDDEKAEVIKFVFDAVIGYESYSSIVYTVNRRWKHLFKSCFWEKSLHEIVRKPIYAGYQYNTAGDLIKNRQGPAIISLSQFLQAQEVVKYKRLKHSGNRCNIAGENRHWLPLSGLLYCGNCHSKLVAGIEKGKINYYCRRGCLNKTLLCRDSRIAVRCNKPYTVGLLDAVQSLLGAALLNRAEKLDKLSDIEQERKDLDLTVFSREQRLQTLSQEYCRGNLPENVYRRVLDELNRELREYHWRALQLSSASELDPAAEAARWQLLFANYRENQLLPGEYELLLRECIDRIIVYYDRITIHWCDPEQKPLNLPRKRILRQNGFSAHAISRLRRHWIKKLQKAFDQKNNATHDLGRKNRKKA